MRAIITFHSVDDSSAVLSYSPSLFSQLLDTLHRKNIPVVDIDTLLEAKTESGVALTFDDGMRSVYVNALPIIKEYAVPAHVYLTTDLVGRTGLWPDTPRFGQYEMLNWSEIESLQSAGVIIDAHTCTHPDMRNHDKDFLAIECRQSNEVIRGRTGRQPAHFAYPFGSHNTVARNVAASFYKTAVTTELDYLGGGLSDQAALPRLDSYYLQSTMALNSLGTLPGIGYVKARSVLRSIAGSQWKASTP